MLANFRQAVEELAETDSERAKILDISERNVRYWRTRDLNILKKLIQYPSLIAALVADAQTPASETPPDS
jgi:hypothetical protein